jgi:hypothetical protein
MIRRSHLDQIVLGVEFVLLAVVQGWPVALVRR